MEGPDHAVGEPAKESVVRVVAGVPDGGSVEGGDAIRPEEKAVHPRGGGRSVSMNPENTEILVGVGVTDLLHLDHKLEMGTVLRQNRCGRLLFGDRKNPSRPA